MNDPIQWLSLVGAAMILTAFLALQRGWWSSHGRLYLWSNFIGAALLTVVALYDQRIGFVLLESTWAAVSLWSLVGTAQPATRP